MKSPQQFPTEGIAFDGACVVYAGGPEARHQLLVSSTHTKV
jgi:hypothetical protein